MATSQNGSQPESSGNALSFASRLWGEIKAALNPESETEVQEEEMTPSEKAEIVVEE